MLPSILQPQQTAAYREKWIQWVHELQDRICRELESVDGGASFLEELWERELGTGGGGKTRILAGGRVFEKAGVNSSVVHGKVSEKMKAQLQLDGDAWFACGISIVIHPLNPYVPTVHANWRYFELFDQTGALADRWFGGGSDLTPYYLFEEDAIHFHRTLKGSMDPFGMDLYPRYKQGCDQYFSNTHRDHEMRGIGGVFYDHLRMHDEEEANHLFQFQQANGESFLKAYLPIVLRRMHMPYGEPQIEWQEIRRGRYVEFNLLHDRGTLFGLKTHGRTESILMSLPPRARWIYNYEPKPGSEEEKLLEACRHPRTWC
jgi:coproporphyrinogen III oxidase